MLTVEKLAQELKETPELKRSLVMRVARELLDSEAFMEAYPRIYETARNKTDANDEMAKNARKSHAQTVMPTSANAT